MDNNNNGSGTNTILIVLALVILVGLAVWLFMGGFVVDDEQNGLNVNVEVPESMGSGSSGGSE